MTWSKVSTLLHVLAAIAMLMDVAFADPQKLENAEFKEDLGDEFDDARPVPALGESKLHLQFELQHQMDVDTPFTPRGVVEIVTSASSPKPDISFSALPTLSGSDVVKLKQLLRDGRHYTVRAKADPSDMNSSYTMTSVPMCMLAAMRLREDFAFHLSDSGKLIAIEYLTPYVDCATCAEFETSSLEDMRFSPFGTVVKAQTGPSPPKHIVVKRDRGVEPVQTENGNDEVEEESQSFLRKYWYIVLPIVVMSLFGGGGAAPAGGPDGAPASPAAGGRQQ